MIFKKSPNLVEKLRRKIKRSLESDKNIVNKKPPNLVKVLRKKTDILYISLQLREISLKGEVGAQKIEILKNRKLNR